MLLGAAVTADISDQQLRARNGANRCGASVHRSASAWLVRTVDADTVGYNQNDATY
jgi:hypothetical protein